MSIFEAILFMLVGLISAYSLIEIIYHISQTLNKRKGLNCLCKLGIHKYSEPNITTTGGDLYKDLSNGRSFYMFNRKAELKCEFCGKIKTEFYKEEME